MSEPACEFPRQNANSETVRKILKESKIIAIVGLSDQTDRPSYRVGAYLLKQGYQVIPVNPNAQEILGQKVYPDLTSVPFSVDVVDIFRKPEAVPGIVEEAIRIKAKTIWMQEGVVHNGAADQARKAGMQVVMNKCMLKEHQAMN